MDGACRIRGEVKCNTGFWLGNQKGRDHLDDVCVDRIKKMGPTAILYNVVDCIHLAQRERQVVSCEHGNEPLVP